jgi:hypothetical protein
MNPAGVATGSQAQLPRRVTVQEVLLQHAAVYNPVFPGGNTFTVKRGAAGCPLQPWPFMNINVIGKNLLPFVVEQETGFSIQARAADR